MCDALSGDPCMRCPLCASDALTVGVQCGEHRPRPGSFCSSVGVTHTPWHHEVFGDSTDADLCLFLNAVICMIARPPPPHSVGEEREWGGVSLSVLFRAGGSLIALPAIGSLPIDMPVGVCDACLG